MAKDYAQEFTDSIIKIIESGETLPWRKSWQSRDFPHQNLKSGSAYSGVNVLMLLVSSYLNGLTSPYWLTFKQAKEMGGKVKKGSKGTAITFYKSLTVDDETAPDGEATIHVRRFYTVFNLDQIEGIEAPEAAFIEGAELTPDENKGRLERHLMAYAQAEGITHRVSGGSAYYSPVADLVNMPTGFTSVAGYAGTLAHEYIHSTGHKSRLNRFESGATSTKEHKEAYAAEELVAELGAGMLCGLFGLESDVVGHASYIESWLRHLRGNKDFVFKAAAKAQKAINLIDAAANLEQVQAA